MANGTAFEIAPEAESLTVTLMDPGAAIREPGTAAVRSVLSPKPVARGVPFHSITEDVVKPLPPARRVNAP
jgi:hypothetical protein